MKYLLHIFLISYIVLKPLVPFTDYAINYSFIVKNLCENRNQPQSTCKGKCYLSKQLAKSLHDDQKQNTLKINIPLDAFIGNETLSFTNLKSKEWRPSQIIFSSPSHYKFSLLSSIFRPPLV